MPGCDCGRNVQSRCVLLFLSDLTPCLPALPPPMRAAQARLRWQSLNTDPLLAFISLCLAGDFPGNTTQAPGPFLGPGPEQLPTPAGARAASVPGTSQGPQDPPPRLKLTEAVRVLCEIEKVAIAIQRRFLQQESIPESSLYLGHPSCNVSDHNSTHVLLVAGWTECGTVVQSNVTNTVVRTMLRNDLSPEGIIHHLKILSPIHCAFQNDLLTSSGYTPEWGVYTIIEDLHGAGSFVTEMQLFIGDSPIPQNYSVSASDDIKIEVGLCNQKSNLKVVLTECWATPSSNARDPVTFGFINNRIAMTSSPQEAVKHLRHTRCPGDPSFGLKVSVQVRSQAWEPATSSSSWWLSLPWWQEQLSSSSCTTRERPASTTSEPSRTTSATRCSLRRRPSRPGGG
ncbi:uromodulin-like 1 isoform X4 [Leptonychotes weddellii]|uniref:Uromodulin-like 1 isoform X4 n=1 Tax=Leptonychotes weddellii TaxID=9713 RepID=A0A7F8QZ69_LEPWE|nr:uromodulin-like 1 isoform X4 [Leptonychotes weddellii]